MARRKVTAAVAVQRDELLLPDELVACEVEDWVAPEEPASAAPAIERVDLSWFQIVARRRWCAARRAFEVAHRLPRFEVDRVAGSCRPSFRDDGLYVAALTRRSR